jgi:arabinofuranan 3-O-arabinosyltransferase
VTTQAAAIADVGEATAAGLRRAEQLCAAVVLAVAVYLAASLIKGAWLVDGRGFAYPIDFVNVWAAGRLALNGHAAAAYDWTLHKQAEVAALGHGLADYGSWSYPPPFLFIAAALARLPYFAAFVVWMGITWSAFALAMRAILGHRLGVLLAAAFPATALNLAVGQNGFFTAALIGATLLLLERRPILAGICLGLLSYKPQFGLLFPLVLAAAGYWRTFVTAAVVAVAMALAAWLAFGSEAWMAFMASLPVNSKAVLSDGLLQFAKLQSVFGLIRAFGGSEVMAWGFQIPVALAVTLGVALFWRRPAPFDLKAAALAVGTLLVTPYVFVYDLPVLALATAFLIRLMLRTAPLPGEATALIAAAACILAFPFALIPTGILAITITTALILRRVNVGAYVEHAPSDSALRSPG